MTILNKLKEYEYIEIELKEFPNNKILINFINENNNIIHKIFIDTSKVSSFLQNL